MASAPIALANPLGRRTATADSDERLEEEEERVEKVRPSGTD